MADITQAAIDLSNAINSSIIDHNYIASANTLDIQTQLQAKDLAILSTISLIYSDIIDLVYQDKDLAKVFYIKSKLEKFNNLPLTNSEAEGNYIGILENKLKELTANIDQTC